MDKSTELMMQTINQAVEKINKTLLVIAGHLELIAKGADANGKNGPGGASK